MSTILPEEIEKAVNRLRAEGNAKLRLADELERNYAAGADPVAFQPSAELTAESLADAIRKKSKRVSDLARSFGVDEARVLEVIKASPTKFHTPDWRGWVKAKGK